MKHDDGIPVQRNSTERPLRRLVVPAFRSCAANKRLDVISDRDVDVRWGDRR